MTSEEFEEFTLIVGRMKYILSWVEEYKNNGCFANSSQSVNGLDCRNCPLHSYKPEWANLPEHHNMCMHLDSICTDSSCRGLYEKAFSIYAKYALEEALDDI